MSSNWKNYRPEDYHPNFDRRSRYRKKRVNFTCERCGAKRGDERMSRLGRPSKVKVAAAHVNHDPWNARAKLIILCDACHNKHDGPNRAKKTRRTHYRKVREKQIQAGQLEMFGNYVKRVTTRRSRREVPA